MNLEIISKENKHYKDLKKIINEKSDFLFIEGRKLFLEALKSSIKIEKIFIDKKNKAALPEEINAEIIFLDNDLIASLFTTDNKPEKEDLILAQAKKPKYNLSDFLKTKKDLVFLERAQDPGNLGTIIRSALSFSAGGILLSKDSAYPFTTKVIRASAGAVFSLPVEYVDSVELLKKLAKENDYKLISTSKNSSKDVRELDASTKKIFLLGNEGNGLSQSVMDLSDESVFIPQSDETESLNLGVAASILLWESFRNKK